MKGSYNGMRFWREERRYKVGAMADADFDDGFGEERGSGLGTQLPAHLYYGEDVLLLFFVLGVVVWWLEADGIRVGSGE